MTAGGAGGEHILAHGWRHSGLPLARTRVCGGFYFNLSVSDASLLTV